MSVDHTADRIIVAALKTFLSRGIRRSSLTDVAHEAGVTRVTVYRYFGDKTGLVGAVCRHLGGIFGRAAAGDPLDPSAEVDARIRRLAEELALLPPGNLLAYFDELRRLYPAIHEELRVGREKALDQLFEQAMAAAVREGTLRDGINLQVVKAMFWTSVVGLIENAALKAAGVPLAEICETVTAVLRHGMLKGSDDRPFGA